jgi:hypothetical protein
MRRKRERHTASVSDTAGIYNTLISECVLLLKSGTCSLTIQRTHCFSLGYGKNIVGEGGVVEVSLV